MRRLILVIVTLGVLGLVFYRWRALDRWEQELHIGDRPASRRSAGR